ncbi:NAD(P)H-binding protein [Knoellia sp. CPCC 206453]|uniref:NAD(P)H-binding protein n=1 Tax=Knoellia pratensis TaxID=3404796 RepID=UPI0036063ABC
MTSDQHVRVLVTGATGYIGSRLVPALLAAGHEVRVLTRSADRLTSRDWHDAVDIIEGDATSRADLDRALTDIDVAYYLLHSMDGGADFEERDRELARTFGLAAQAADVQRLVYLSGLHPDEKKLSTHLASRVEVGDLLMASGVPTVVLQAAIIIGSGSASFEMLRHLTHNLPVMLTPKWVNNRIQPIAIGDVLHYLIGAATLGGEHNRTFDIGGPDVLTYRDMIHRFARVAGLRDRAIVTVPVLTPGLASHWVGLVTPVPSGIAKPLVGSLIHEVVCQENDVDDVIGAPEGGAMTFEDSVKAALVGKDETTRPEPGTVEPARLTAADPDWAG